MLVTLKEGLKDSVKNRYALGAFNVANHDMAEGIIQAAEEKQLPIIISVAELHFETLDLDNFIYYLQDRINRTEVPIVLHLDHGYSYETVIRAIHYGFSSVMFDGSKLSYQENKEQTKELVKVAHAAGVSVEAELGHVAGLEGELEAGSVADEKAFTDPDDAKRFVKETGIDALAIAIGTVHGLYEGEPQIDYERLDKIRERLEIPLVLHGGTGLYDKDYRRVVEHGINKINYHTGISLPIVNNIKDIVKDDKGKLRFADITVESRKKVKEIVKNKMETFGTQALK